MSEIDEEYFETGALQDDDATERDILVGHPEPDDEDDDGDEAEGGNS